jgi:hypothetical protein
VSIATSYRPLGRASKERSEAAVQNGLILLEGGLNVSGGISVGARFTDVVE